MDKKLKTATSYKLEIRRPKIWWKSEQDKSDLDRQPDQHAANASTQLNPRGLPAAA